MLLFNFAFYEKLRFSEKVYSYLRENISLQIIAVNWNIYVELDRLNNYRKILDLYNSEYVQIDIFHYETSFTWQLLIHACV